MKMAPESGPELRHARLVDEKTARRRLEIHHWLARGTRYERGLLGDFEEEPNMLASFFGISRKHEFQKRLEARKPVTPGLMEAIRQEQAEQYVPKHLRSSKLS